MQSTGIGEKHWAISKNWSDYLGLPPQCSIICQISFYREANNEQNIAFPISPAILTWSSDKLLYNGFDCETVTVTRRKLLRVLSFTQSVFMFWDYCFLNMLIMLPGLTQSCGSRREEPCKMGTVWRGNRDKEDTEKKLIWKWMTSQISGRMLWVHLWSLPSCDRHCSTQSILSQSDDQGPEVELHKQLLRRWEGPFLWLASHWASYLQ